MMYYKKKHKIQRTLNTHSDVLLYKDTTLYMFSIKFNLYRCVYKI